VTAQVEGGRAAGSVGTVSLVGPRLVRSCAASCPGGCWCEGRPRGRGRELASARSPWRCGRRRAKRAALEVVEKVVTERHDDAVLSRHGAGSTPGRHVGAGALVPARVGRTLGAVVDVRRRRRGPLGARISPAGGELTRGPYRADPVRDDRPGRQRPSPATSTTTWNITSPETNNAYTAPPPGTRRRCPEVATPK
jgi:hypothetical protein